MARTTIALSTETRDALKRLGRKGESYDTILRRLLARDRRTRAVAALKAAGPRQRNDMDVV